MLKLAVKMTRCLGGSWFALEVDDRDAKEVNRCASTADARRPGAGGSCGMHAAELISCI